MYTYIYIHTLLYVYLHISYTDAPSMSILHIPSGDTGGLARLHELPRVPAAEGVKARWSWMLQARILKSPLDMPFCYRMCSLTI